VTPFVSVIICTRNRPDLIGQAVASVLANDYPKFELVVIDQSTDDQTGAILRGVMAEHANVRYIHSSIAGLSRAYNTGVRESTGELLAFTDDDCVAAQDWMSSVVAAFEADPEADLLYGQVLRAPSLAGVKGEVPELSFDRAERLSHRDGFRVFGMGANFAARRRLFQKVGGFDEALGGGGPLKSSQDYDLQYRVYRAGSVVLLTPSARVDHFGLRDYATQWPATMRAYGFGDGAFYAKHVRCGDMFALKLLLRQLAWSTTREALSRIGLRRRPSRWEYITSCVMGMWQSLRFPVDCRQRLYREPARA
jgi:glycosyltransferase involved in cell wall biosynthesis